MNLIKAGLLIFISLLLSSCGGGSGTGGSKTGDLPSATLNNIQVSPTAVTVTINKTATLSAKGVNDNGSTVDLAPSQVTWEVAASGVASVDGNGVVSGTSAGTTTVTAKYKGLSSSTDINVTTGALNSLTIASAPTILAKGGIAQLVAYGTFEGGTTSVDLTTQVTWSSSAPAIASIGAHTGSVQAVSDGTSSISAELSGIAATPVSIAVTSAKLGSIAITSVSTSIAKGTSTQLKAIGSYDNGSIADLTTLATWTSTAPTIVAVGANTGIAVGTHVGSATVSASFNGITSNNISMNVIASIGGTLSGLATGNSITLSNNGTDNLTLNANGAFTFSNLFASGTAYNLSITSVPSNQECNSLYGAGVVGTDNIGMLSVFCGMKNTGTPSWATSGNLVTTGRYGHTATLLPNGKVLVAGGIGLNIGMLTSAELYDPVAGTWSATGSLSTGRLFHTATLLPNGKVLVAAGGSNLASAELYDPATGKWTPTGNLIAGRSSHTATLLPNGQVLVAGGAYLSSSELYDPASEKWVSTGNLVSGRSNHTATLLPNGKVLVAGGYGYLGSALGGQADARVSAELYDPDKKVWTATGDLTTARYIHSATLLPNGKVLVVGGYGSSSYLASAELYDPAAGGWTTVNSLAAARFGHTATLLANGKVLVGGGKGSANTVLSSAELFDPAAGISGGWATAGSFASVRYYHSATLLPSGKVLVAGGYDDGLSYPVSTVLYW